MHEVDSSHANTSGKQTLGVKATVYVNECVLKRKSNCISP